MRAITVNLTAVLLVIHAMIGCCHHDWQCGSEGSPADKVATCGCCDHHGATQGDVEENPAPCDSQQECHGVCNYVPTQRAVDGTLDGSNNRAVAIAIPKLIHYHAAASVACWADVVPPDDSPPPLRLHLLYQLLLI